MDREPEEIVEARELLNEFEKSPGMSKKNCFVEGIKILNDFLTEHQDSKFSQRANNLKNIYTKLLIRRLGTIVFSDRDDWEATLVFVADFYGGEIIKALETYPELGNDWQKFINFYKPWREELVEYIKNKIK
jgi:hypothetical protein